MWLTESEFSKMFSLSRTTLANWRHMDKKAGRIRPGYPAYRRFGRAVRYFVEDIEKPKTEEVITAGMIDGLQNRK